jgi:hypothetical protein
MASELLEHLSPFPDGTRQCGHSREALLFCPQNGMSTFPTALNDKATLVDNMQLAVLTVAVRTFHPFTSLEWPHGPHC